MAYLMSKFVSQFPRKLFIYLVYIDLIFLPLAIIILLLVKAFSKKTLQAKTEITVICLTFCLAFGPYLLIYFLPHVFITPYKPPINGTFLLALFAILPIGLTYSIMQYQSFGIRKLMRRDLAYALITLLLFSFYLLIFQISHQVAGTSEVPVEFLLLVTLVVAVCFGRLHNWLQRLLDILIFKDFYDYQKVLQNLSGQLSQQASLEEVSRVILSEFNRIFNLEFASLSVYNQQKVPDQLYYAKILRTENEAQTPLKDHFSDETLPLYLGVFPPVRLPTQERFFLLWHTQSGLPMAAVELAINNQLCAVLLLGAKASGEPFNGNDAGLVETIIGTIRVSLQNALLVAELELRVRQLQNFSEQLRRSKDELQQLNHQMLKIGEEERVRLARELHDEPLQRLMLILRLFDEQDETISERERFCWDLAKEVSASLRTICTQLRPWVLEDMGLEAALRWLAERVRTESNLAIRVLIDLEDGTDDDHDLEIVLYRTAQEALQNVIKHSGASQVELELIGSKGKLNLRICDNGRGFVMPEDTNMLVSQGHFGLVGMRERLNNIGGRLIIESQPGVGTFLEVQV
jgi:two-component system sensor histidine kinase ComP